jgi:hypothetical protein
VTADIYDYPLSLFDISKVDVIEDGKRAMLVGFITYDDSKIKRIENDFLKSA